MYLALAVDKTVSALLRRCRRSHGKKIAGQGGGCCLRDGDALRMYKEESKVAITRNATKERKQAGGGAAV